MKNNFFNQKTYNELFTLGTIQDQKLMTFLFYVGIIPLIYWSITFGSYISVTNTYWKTIRTQSGMYTGIEANNVVLGLLAGIIFFIVVFMIWKVVCELFLLIFRTLRRMNH